MGGLFSDHSKEKLNSENIDNEFVYRVTCRHCASILSERGCKINFASELSISGFSADSTYSEVTESKEFAKWIECSCLSLKIYCKKCNNQCGYRLLYLCLYCQKQPTNGHNWLFLNVDGTQTSKRWKEIEKRPIVTKSFEEVLTIAGVSSSTLQVLKKEEIQSFSQLQLINDQLLRDAGLSLGQLARLRQFK